MLITAREADRPKSVPGKTLIYSDGFKEVYVEVIIVNKAVLTLFSGICR